MAKTSGFSISPLPRAPTFPGNFLTCITVIFCVLGEVEHCGLQQKRLAATAACGLGEEWHLVGDVRLLGSCSASAPACCFAASGSPPLTQVPLPSAEQLGNVKCSGHPIFYLLNHRSWAQETEQEPSHPRDEEEDEGEEDGASEDQAWHDWRQAQKEQLSKATLWCWCWVCVFMCVWILGLLQGRNAGRAFSGQILAGLSTLCSLRKDITVWCPRG